jgi:hypothetical protein
LGAKEAIFKLLETKKGFKNHIQEFFELEKETIAELLYGFSNRFQKICFKEIGRIYFWFMLSKCFVIIVSISSQKMQTTY